MALQLVAAALLGLSSLCAATAEKKPNIVFLLSDDQDRKLGSMDFMETLQNEMIAKGLEATNHFTTSAQCCPSRVTLLRGQAAHNTNVTHVFSPGGNYEKFMLSGQVNDYIPHWMKKAGYRTEYIGKFLNGVNILNWHIPPAGWDHIEYLMEPYQTTPNNVVMSMNGEHPLAYQGYHQTDIIRAKALSRLQTLIDGEDPFFLFLSPTAPHADDETFTTVPLQRHMDLFPDAAAPRYPNFNPSDEVQSNAGGWIKNIPEMNEGNITWSDGEYRRRLQALQGIDEMLADLLKKLEENGVLDNTYVVFSSDNGYHLGNHRMTAGKATAFIEDTNLPFVVRGPGIRPGSKVTIPSSFIDMAPTFLDIAGVPKEDRPVFLDGRSVLQQWKDPNAKCEGTGEGNNFEVLNVEYWGSNGVYMPGPSTSTQNATYKSLRIVGESFAYLYTHWCYSNELELYNTVDDPYEVKNLARNPDYETQRLLNRLNAMLLVTKSCSTDVCQNPWTVLMANSTLPSVTTLKVALDPVYDDHFAAFPKIHIAQCLGFQSTANEAPFWPPSAEEYLYENKNSTASLDLSRKYTPMVRENETPQGTLAQRHVTIEEIMKGTRKLSEEELDKNQKSVIRTSGRGN